MGPAWAVLVGGLDDERELPPPRRMPVRKAWFVGTSQPQVVTTLAETSE